MESQNLEIVEEIKRVKRGRPKNNVVFDKLGYCKDYYENNKKKWQGDFVCVHCNLLCSKSNKSRHIKTHHPEHYKKKLNN